MYQSVELPGKDYYEIANINMPAEINVRYMTIREVQHFVSLVNTGNGEFFADSILKACIKEPIDVNLLLEGDRLYLFYVIRALTMGNEYAFDINCESCGSLLPAKVNIFELPIKKFDKNKYSFPITVTLPVSKRTVSFVLPTRQTQKQVEQEIKQMKLSNPTAEVQDVILLYRKIITAVDNEKDISTVINFIDNMHFMDWRFLDNFIKKILPGLDLDAIVICENCNHANKVSFSIRPVEFFRLQFD